MKKIGITLLLGLALTAATPPQSRAQSIADVIQQLALDYQKLASLKNILGQLYTGYTVLSKGYGAVKDVAQGNFSLHKAFLDGLYLVSPAVRQYPRVADIISEQAQLISEYRNASGAFRQDGRFSPDELGYMMDVYNNLISRSLQNLDDLSLVVTDSRLRMSDAERLTAIDRLYLESHNQLSYLRRFNEQAAKTGRQRARGENDRRDMQSIYGSSEGRQP